MIRRSSRASPGGSSAGRTSWTRRSEFVTVPRLSAHAAAAGNTTSAISPVAVRKMSWTISVSRPRRSFSVRWRSASDCIGFSPTTYSAVSSPRSIASNISDRCQPRFGGTRTPHRLSHLSRSSSFSTCWNPTSRSGSAPMSPPPWTLFWPRSGLMPLPYLPTCPVSRASEISDEHVVDRVVVLGDAERPADHRAVGLGVRVRRLADRRRRHARLALGVLERVRLDARAIVLEAGRRPVDELLVREAGVDDLAPHRVGERDVGADVEAQPQVGPLGARRPPRVDRDQPGTPAHPLQEVVEEDRMRLPGVAAPQEEAVRLLSFLI